jgi:hypothetical protein
VKRLRDTDLAERSFRLKLGIPMFLLCWFAFMLALARGEIERGTYTLLVWVVAPLLAWLCSRGMLLVIDRFARGLLHALLGSGGGEGHSREYSEQEALVVAGRIDEAADSFRAHLVAFPDDREAKLRLAALLAGPGQRPREAERLYLAVREQGPSARQESVVSNALIDLYRRTGQQPRLRAELARYARLHPGTLGGEGARRELRELVAAEHAVRGDL